MLNVVSVMVSSKRRVISSIAGMTMARLGVPREKKSVASFKI